MFLFSVIGALPIGIIYQHVVSLRISSPRYNAEKHTYAKFDTKQQ